MVERERDTYCRNKERNKYNAYNADVYHCFARMQNSYIVALIEEFYEPVRQKITQKRELPVSSSGIKHMNTSLSALKTYMETRN